MSKGSEGDYEDTKRKISQRVLNRASLFALSFQKLGYRADSLILSCENLQRKWAKEHGIKLTALPIPHIARKSYFVRFLFSKFPKMYYFLKGLTDKKSLTLQILLSQIQDFKPDVLFIFDFHYFTPEFLKAARKYVGKIVGCINAPIYVPDRFFKSYDMLFSPFPHYVEMFQKMGISSAYFPFAFEPTILKEVGDKERIHDCVFIGGLSKGVDKIPFFEELAKKVNVKFWGHMNPPLSPASPILSTYQGTAWGIDMYKILAQSKIVINRHVIKHESFSSKYADNVRLYESTGMGCLLITDWKKNLGELFEIGKEVETYRTLDELVEKVRYYLTHDKEREKIAQAGQKRTLRDHTYEERSKKLSEIIK
ncbi:MAG: glycosyltransferase [Nanoarchaeota archaeon]